VVFGWTWEYCEKDLLMPQIRALSKYLSAHPPLHLVAAAFAGVKPQREPEQTNLQLFSDFGAAGGTVKG